MSAATNAVLDHTSYDRVTVIGKSLGTLAMTHVFDIEPRLRGAGAVWLTPLLADRRLHACIASPDRASLIVMGTRDPQYNSDHLAQLRAAGHRTLVLENAGHSLGVEGDLVRTLKMLQETVETVAQFLDRSQGSDLAVRRRSPSVAKFHPGCRTSACARVESSLRRAVGTAGVLEGTPAEA